MNDQNYEHYYAVVMAGGGGTRLWPLSRKKRPKQMLSLFEERTMFQTSVQRLYGVFPPERVLIVTVEEQAGELQAQTPEIPAQNFLIEPQPRGTASVVGYAALALHQRDPLATMAVVTADHFIGNNHRFHKLLRIAFDVAQDGYLVTLGIEPTFPATGFGYIHYGERLGFYQGQQVFRAIRFREKPDEEQARQMLAGGDHAWNSGMFIWRVEHILAEFARQMPQLYATLLALGEKWDRAEFAALLAQLWPGLKNETIDYGIMEQAERVAVIPAAGLEWNDIGSWDSLFDVLEGDHAGNIVIGGQHFGLDTTNTLVYVDQERRLIVTIGVNDLVVVDTGDVLLVCHKEQAQRVRQVVQHLKEKGEHYL